MGAGGFGYFPDWVGEKPGPDEYVGEDCIGDLDFDLDFDDGYVDGGGGGGDGGDGSGGGGKGGGTGRYVCSQRGGAGSLCRGGVGVL